VFPLSSKQIDAHLPVIVGHEIVQLHHEFYQGGIGADPVQVVWIALFCYLSSIGGAAAHIARFFCNLVPTQCNAVFPTEGICKRFDFLLDDMFDLVFLSDHLIP